VRNLIGASLLLVAAAAMAETVYYRVELVPSGSLVAIGAPVARGTTLLIHAYPDGKLMSLRKSDVRSFAAITAEQAATPAQKSLVPIGNLAMQGGGAQAPTGSSRGATARPAAQPAAQGPHIVPTADGLAITTDPPK
jgi:hypothetical protein